MSVPRFASIYPLVSARALARPFTYLADGLEKGSVVSVPFGRARRRGIVVGAAPKAVVSRSQRATRRPALPVPPGGR